MRRGGELGLGLPSPPPPRAKSKRKRGKWEAQDNRLGWGVPRGAAGPGGGYRFDLSPLGWAFAVIIIGVRGSFQAGLGNSFGVDS